MDSHEIRSLRLLVRNRDKIALLLRACDTVKKGVKERDCGKTQNSKANEFIYKRWKVHALLINIQTIVRQFRVDMNIYCLPFFKFRHA